MIIKKQLQQKEYKNLTKLITGIPLHKITAKTNWDGVITLQYVKLRQKVLTNTKLRNLI